MWDARPWYTLPQRRFRVCLGQTQAEGRASLILNITGVIVGAGLVLARPAKANTAIAV